MEPCPQVYEQSRKHPPPPAMLKIQAMLKLQRGPVTTSESPPSFELTSFIEFFN